MKLSPAQKKVLDQARKEVQEAREASSLEDYYIKYQTQYYRYPSLDEIKLEQPVLWKVVYDTYTKALQGIVLTQAAGPTIRKLESLGLIKILKDSTGTGSYRFDTIQVL